MRIENARGVKAVFADKAALAGPVLKSVILMAALAAYSNSLKGVFIFDDIQAVVENPSIRSFFGAFFPPANLTVTGRPVANLTLGLNLALGGYDVFGYHLVNIAVHLIAALVLYGLLRRALSTLATEKEAMGLAAASALLWAVHPLTTSAVTYIIQRCESLASLFYLLSIYCLARGGDSERQAGWLAASVFACLLAVGSKEIAASAPLVALLYDRTFIAGSFRAALRRRWLYYCGMAASWALLAYLVVSAGNRTDTAGLDVGYKWWEYAATQVYAVPHYLRLAVWPSPLVFDYGERLIPVTPHLLPYALVLAALLAATAYGVWKRNGAGFAGALFFSVLAPSSSIITVSTQTMAEHRMYLPLAAVISVAVYGCHRLWKHFIGKSSLLWVAVVVAAALIVVTRARNEDYSSDFRLWKDTVAKAPGNYRGYEGIALNYFEERDYNSAFAALDEAESLKPVASTAIRLATALLKEGRNAEAELLLRRSARKWNNAQVVNLLGVSLSLQGKSTEAIEYFERAVAMAPGSELYRKNLSKAKGGK